MTTEDAHALALKTAGDLLTKALGYPIEIPPLSDKEQLVWSLRNARDFIRNGQYALALAEIEHALAKQQ